MKRKYLTHFTLLLMALVLITLGCGGSKEIIETPPLQEPFPEPEPAQEEPVEEVAQPQLEAEDIVKKEPVNLMTIYFDFDRSDLTPDAKATLSTNAYLMQENPEITVLIEGHCDERGTVDYNLALGERRALTAKNYLVSYGIDASRIRIISYGKERPADLGHNPQAWAKNRRAEFLQTNE
ncbi:MAG: peptidoglycan-associated lipoprotein Pal [bacterium]